MPDAIRKLRNARNMTQVEVAEKLGITTAELSQHERSAADPPVWMVKDVAVLDCGRLEQLAL